MRLLITGASGLVGGAVARLAAAAGHHVTGTVGRFAGPLAGVTDRITTDLTSDDAINRLVADARPQAIINAAAVSEPAACDADPVRSERLNVALPAQLAQLARAHGIRLVHLSSEQVFGGDRAPYRVGDPVAPLNRYARQKVDSEAAIAAAAGPRAVTIRAPLLGGNSPSGRRSLHERLLADWAAGKAPKLYRDEIRQVADADNLAAVLIELCARTEFHGALHWAGAEPLSRYALGERIRAHFRLDPGRTPIVPVTRAEDPAAAAIRPADLSLDLAPLAGALATRAETLAEQLARWTIPASLRDWAQSARLSV